MGRKTNKQRFPWYDSRWLRVYRECLNHINNNCPERRREFKKAFEPLQVNPTFKTKVLRNVIDQQTIDEIVALNLRTDVDQLETGEVDSYGRFLVHDHPLFTQIQSRMTDQVSKLVGETVAPFFNFIGMYLDSGQLDLHLDSPHSKWTLDICIRQSSPWPIHISKVISWPLEIDCRNKGWDDALKQDPELDFQTLTLEPGDGVLFSGSSQWHYREALRQESGERYGDFLFLHYINKNCEEILEPFKWAEHFNIPKFAKLVEKNYVI